MTGAQQGTTTISAMLYHSLLALLTLLDLVPRGVWHFLTGWMIVNMIVALLLLSTFRR